MDARSGFQTNHTSALRKDCLSWICLSENTLMKIRTLLITVYIVSYRRNSVNTKNHHFAMNWRVQVERANWRLHPLIHTLLKFNLLQNIESINKRSRSSAWYLENEFFVGLLHLRYHMPKNLSAISVERLSTRLTLARV